MALKMDTNLLAQKANELKNNSLNVKLPNNADLWNRLLLSSVADNLPAGIALLNKNFVLCNFNKLYGSYINSYTPFNPGNALGLDYFTYVPGSRYQVIDWFQYVRDNGQQKTVNDFHLRIEGNDSIQDTFWNMTVAPVIGNTGRVRGVLIFAIDSTEPVLTKKALHQKEAKLEQMKCAFRAVLNMREEDQYKLKQKMATNATKTIMPFVESLRKRLSDSDQIAHLDIIESNLKGLTSGFSQTLNSTEFAFTPREIQIAALIKEGKTTKEIAEFFRVSSACIDFHRHNIRAKLGLKNKKANLASFLLSLSRS